MGWQEDQADFMTGSRRALQRGAREEMAGLVAELMPWTLFVNPATFDPWEMAGAAAGELTRRVTSGETLKRSGRAGAQTHLMAEFDDVVTQSCGCPADGPPPHRAGGALPPRVSDSVAVKRFRFWLDRARERLGRPMEGLMALEHGDAWGQAHGHGLVWLSGGLRDGDITKLSRFWREYPLNGYIRLQVPRSLAAVVEYTAKHTVKQMNELVFSVGCGRVFYGDLVSAAVVAARTV